VIAILGGVWRPTQIGSDQPDWIRRPAEVDPVLAGAYAADVNRQKCCEIRLPSTSAVRARIHLLHATLFGATTAVMHGPATSSNLGRDRRAGPGGDAGMPIRTSVPAGTERHAARWLRPTRW